MSEIDYEMLVTILLDKIRTQESLIRYYAAENERLEKENRNDETT